MKTPETNLTFMVPLSYEAHQIAEQQRQPQRQPQRAKQAYLNSLAVYAVDYYLRCLGWTPDRPSSDSENPLFQRFLDSANLLIPGLGRLECRPVLPGQIVCEIPPETWEDRIGYIAVQFESSLRQAEILGFVPNPAAAVPLDQLQSLDQLLIHLDQLSAVSVPASVPATSGLANLSQTLQGLWAQGWQTLDTLRDQWAEPQFAFRSADQRRFSDASPEPEPIAESRGKRLMIGAAQEAQIGLLVNVESSSSQELDVLVRLFPDSNLPQLLPELEVAILDESGSTVMQSRWWPSEPINFEFSLLVGERFSIQVIWDDWNVIEDVFV